MHIRVDLAQCVLFILAISCLLNFTILSEITNLINKLLQLLINLHLFIYLSREILDVRARVRARLCFAVRCTYLFDI